MIKRPFIVLRACFALEASSFDANRCKGETVGEFLVSFHQFLQILKKARVSPKCESGPGLHYLACMHSAAVARPSQRGSWPTDPTPRENFQSPRSWLWRLVLKNAAVSPQLHRCMRHLSAVKSQPPPNQLPSVLALVK